MKYTDAFIVLGIFIVEMLLFQIFIAMIVSALYACVLLIGIEATITYVFLAFFLLVTWAFATGFDDCV